MTKNEQALIRAGVNLYKAMERCIKWSGTGSTRQAQAELAREKALNEWNQLVDKIEEKI